MPGAFTSAFDFVRRRRQSHVSHRSQAGRHQRAVPPFGRRKVSIDLGSGTMQVLNEPQKPGPEEVVTDFGGVRLRSSFEITETKPGELTINIDGPIFEFDDDTTTRRRMTVWLFTRHGFISVTKHPQEPDKLVVQTQTREEIEQVVRLLDEVGGKHEIERAYDGFCRFAPWPTRRWLAQVIARMVVGIDYGRFTQSVNFDFGADPRFLLCMTPTGLQVSRVSPE